MRKKLKKPIRTINTIHTEVKGDISQNKNAIVEHITQGMTIYFYQIVGQQ